MTAQCANPTCDVQFEKNVHNQKYCSLDCKREASQAGRRRQYTIDIADAVAPAYLGDVDVEDRLEYLRKESQRLARALVKEKSAKAEMVTAVYDAALAAFKDFDLPNIPKPSPDRRTSVEEEVAVAGLADWQLGKVSKSYNSQVCKDRIDLYTDKILHIANIMRSNHPVRKLHMWMLGDIVEGEEIFSGQAHLLDSSLYRQVGVNGPEIISKMIVRALEEFDSVHLVGVSGNHGSLGGRNRRDYNSETNMDRLLYRIIELMFANEPRVTFNIPSGHGERSFYAVDSIGDYKALLIHGDQFPQPTNAHPYYKKVMGWKDGGIEEDFDDIFMGHYHHSVQMTIGTSKLRVLGSPESHNTFAQEFVAAMTRPSQSLYFVHPRKGLTSEWSIWLDEV